MSKNAHIIDLWANTPIILALSRHGTLDAAANHLNVNRTTISRRLKSLEIRMGGQLFSRSEGHFHLTALGRECLTAAEGAEANLLMLEDILPESGGEREGPLRITLPAHMLALASPVLIEMAKNSPKLKLDIRCSYRLEDVEAREADIAIRIMKGKPEYPLDGRKVAVLRGALYQGIKKDKKKVSCWVIRSGEDKLPQEITKKVSQLHTIEVDDIIAQQEIIAVDGIGRLPCFIGDVDARLERASDILPDVGWQLWVVSHASFKSSRRVQYAVNDLVRHLTKAVTAISTHPACL